MHANFKYVLNLSPLFDSRENKFVELGHDVAVFTLNPKNLKTEST